MIKLLFTQPLTDFNGRYYTLKEARCEPKPVQKPYPPFVIGGKGEKITLRVVAKHADIWNAPGVHPEEFKRLVGILREHCAVVERDPETITFSIQQMVDYDNLKETAQMIKEFIEVGATHLIFSLRYPYPDGIVERLAEEVIPRVLDS